MWRTKSGVFKRVVMMKKMSESNGDDWSSVILRSRFPGRWLLDLPERASLHRSFSSLFII